MVALLRNLPWRRLAWALSFIGWAWEKARALPRWARWIRAFNRPTPGWENLVREFVAGNHSWPVPGHPDALPTMPWPCAWTCVRVAEPGDALPPGTHPATPADGISVASGRPAIHSQLGARCARCASPLAREDIQTGPAEPPACALCASRVIAVAEGRA